MSYKTKEKFGEFFELFSRIEGRIAICMSSLFSTFPEYHNMVHDIYGLVINYALHKHNIFSGIDQKRRFFDLFLKGMDHLMNKNSFVDKDISAISSTREALKKLEKLQDVRNKIAHRWIIFMDNNDIRFPNDKFFEKAPADRDEIVNLDEKIDEVRKILKELESNHVKLLNLLNRYFIAQKIKYNHFK